MATSMARSRLLANAWAAVQSLGALLVVTLILLWSIYQSWQEALSQHLAADLTVETALLAWLPTHATSHALTAVLLAWSGWAWLRIAYAQRHAERWYRRSIRDPLTGIANRRGLRRYVRTVSRERQIINAPWMVLVIDLDNFKAINDHYGHHIGDQALRSVADLLKSYFKRRDDWLVARLGGDEFIVTIPVMSAEHSKWLRGTVIKDLVKKLNNMILCYGEDSIFFGASIGYAEGDFSGMNSILKLAKKADRSMLSVKQSRHSLSQK